MSKEEDEEEELFNQPQIRNADDEPDLSASESSEMAEAAGLGAKGDGNAVLKAGHYTEAIIHYSIALSHLPNNAIILSNRALAYIKIENYGLAIQDATHAILADPAYPKGYYRRGTAEFALGRAKAARKDFRTVCKLRPKDRDARTRLAECDKAVREAAFAAAILSDVSIPLSDTFKPETILIEKSYDGPHPMPETLDGGIDTNQQQQIPPSLEDTDVVESALFQPGKLPREFVLASMEHFRLQKVIHKRYVAHLLISAKKYYEQLPSLLEIPIPSVGPDVNDPTILPRLTVCGDTHGQFYDVLHIFDLNGLPTERNPYLFNGDFVDRGSFSVEVILTFLLFKMSNPQCIHLHRGNHETKNMNKIYGFEGEVKAKYDDKIFELFLEVFSHMPLASVVGNKVFVTHGGLPTEPGVSLNDIRKIKRGCEPPNSGLMSDLLWADPQPFPGKSPSKRGVGYSFGPDITEAFLNFNDLQLLVRSHEVKDEGYLVEHGGKTITVFSAPNYCDSMGNKGAFIHFEESCEPKFTQYEAVPHPDVRPMAYAAGMGGLFM
jgi:serine/threonine-protein phosphatase 5